MRTNKNVVYLTSLDWVDLLILPGASASECLIPIRIQDESLEEFGICENDYLVTDLAREPDIGEFSAVETLQGILLGFYFEEPDNRIRLESACPCFRCYPRYLQHGSILRVGPIVRFFSTGENLWYQFTLRKVKRLE